MKFAISLAVAALATANAWTAARAELAETVIKTFYDNGSTLLDGYSPSAGLLHAAPRPAAWFSG